MSRIRLLQVRTGPGTPITLAGAQEWAKYDLIIADRGLAPDLAGQGIPNVFAYVKGLNPNVQIFVYAVSHSTMDTYQSPETRTNIGRYNGAEGHSQGDLNNNNPGFFLLSSGGSRLHRFGLPSRNWLDFSNPDFSAYAVEALLADIVGRAWEADGIFTDNAPMVWSADALTYLGSTATRPANLSTDTAWRDAVKTHLLAVAQGLWEREGIPFAANSGHLRLTLGREGAAWLNANVTTPYLYLEESAFAVFYGPGPPTEYVQFYPYDSWKSQIDGMLAFSNPLMRIGVMSHAHHPDWDTPYPSNLMDVTGREVLWYALGSYMLGRRDDINNAYFYFQTPRTSIGDFVYYPEYEHFEFGAAVNPTAYQTETSGAATIHKREFAKGWVYVNPTNSDSGTLTLPEPLRVLTKDNFELADKTSIPATTTLTLPARRAAFLLKLEDPDMALGRNSDALAWAAAASKSVAAASGELSDAYTFAAGTVAAALQVNVANNGTEAAGDTVDAYVCWSTGDVLGDTGDDFDSVDQATYLGRIDVSTSAKDPARQTFPINVGAKAFKLYTYNNSATNSVTVRAMVSDLRNT